MDSTPKLLFALFLVCLLAWQLSAGYTFGKGWRPQVFREKNPGKYWLAILVQVAVLAVFVVTGKTSWEWSSDSDEEEAVAVPTRAEQRRAEAFELHRTQQVAKAIPIYDELLQEQGDDTELLYWRGMAHWKLGDGEAAMQDFRRVIDLEPTNLDAHRGADRLLATQQRWDEILALWNAYIRASPSDPEAYYERGGTHFRKGDLAAARTDVARACELGKPEACSRAQRLGAKQ